MANERKYCLQEIRLRKRILTTLTALLVTVGASLYVQLSLPVPALGLLVLALPGAVLLCTLLLSGFIYGYVRFVNQNFRLTAALSEGRPQEVTTVKAGASNEWLEHLKKIAGEMQTATAFAAALGKGNLEATLDETRQSSLIRALSGMRDYLRQLAEEERRRTWTISGQAKLDELLRNHQQSDIKTLAKAFIDELSHYMLSHQGAVYLVHEEEEPEPYLELTAGYACHRDQPGRVAWREGLLGQSVYEKEAICLDAVPETFYPVTSGLGAARPKSVVLVPVQRNERVYGAVELAFLQQLPQYQLQFVENVCGSFAAALENVLVKVTTQQLLQESERKAEALRAQEEVLRQNTEELVAMQQELNQKLKQIEEESVLTKSILDAINKTNAALELDMQGTILNVNDMYLSLMEYTAEELIGSPEKNFVSPDELNSQRYDLMWESVRTGAYNSGEFKRMSKSGRELWLTGTYSPIFNLEGQPYKIVQFAQFTTEQKERELELVSKIDALNQAVAMVEISLEGKIITGNSVFLKSFGFKRIELRNKCFLSLLDAEVAQSEEFGALWNSLCQGTISQRNLRMHSGDGSYKHYLVWFSPSKNLQGRTYRVLAILIDLTEQHTLREQLDDMLIREKRKNAILEMQAEANDEFISEVSDILIQLDGNNSHVDISPIIQRKNIPIIEFSLSGEIVLVNQAAANLLGKAPHRLVHTSFFDQLQFSDEEEQRHFKTHLEKAVLMQAKLRFHTVEDPSIRFSVYLAPHFAPDTKTHTVVLIIICIEKSEPSKLQEM